MGGAVFPGVSPSRTISGGGLITGGGDLSVDRTLSFPLEDLQDNVAAMLVAGMNMAITYNDTTGKVTFDASGGGGGGTITVSTPDFVALSVDSLSFTGRGASYVNLGSGDVEIHIPGGSTPTIRAASYGAFNANTINVPLPAGTIADDVVFVWVENGFQGTTIGQAGWNILDTFGHLGDQQPDQLNTWFIAKKMTAGDIVTGFVTVNFNGVFNGVYGAVTITKDTLGGIRQMKTARSAGAGALTSANASLELADDTDLILGFTATRAATAVGITGFTQLGTNNGAAASGFLGNFTGANALLGLSAVCTYTAGTGYYWAFIALKGV